MGRVPGRGPHTLGRGTPILLPLLEKMSPDFQCHCRPSGSHFRRGALPDRKHRAFSGRCSCQWRQNGGVG